MLIPDISWVVLLPTLLVTGTGFAVLLADLAVTGPDKDGLGWIGLIGLAVAAIASVALWNTAESSFAGTIVLDRYAVYFNVLFCVAAGLTLLMSMDYLGTIDLHSGEYYAIVLFATAGMFLMAAANDLIVLFLGLETMSIAAYVLAGIRRRDLRSSEAAMKYFLLGAFATGFLLFGIALLYGAFQTTALGPVARELGASAGLQRVLAGGGMALLLVGFAFKIAAVPFHAWAPDVYEGSPTSITAFMAVGVKAAAFAAFVRVFMHAFAVFAAEWSAVLAVLAVATMSLGNLAALRQTNIKRLLAYSSIAHAGYLLVGMVAGTAAAGAAVLYYLLAYTLMNTGAFAVVIALGKRGEANESLDDFDGVGVRHPLLGFCMTVFMLSLAGIPALAGFTGKFYLFSAAVQEGYVWLAIVGVLNSVVSMYYYGGVLMRMFMADGGVEVQGTAHRPYLAATLVATAAGTVYLGIFPSWAFELAHGAFLSLR
jgi:NADH-quinone oxidoreductase subunit N